MVAEQVASGSTGSAAWPASIASAESALESSAAAASCWSVAWPSSGPELDSTLVKEMFD